MIPILFLFYPHKPTTYKKDEVFQGYTAHPLTGLNIKVPIHLLIPGTGSGKPLLYGIKKCGGARKRIKTDTPAHPANNATAICRY